LVNLLSAREGLPLPNQHRRRNSSVFPFQNLTA
jgi:hypothetical protein